MKFKIGQKGEQGVELKYTLGLDEPKISSCAWNC